MSKQDKEYASFLLDNGQIVQIEYPSEHEDDFWESASNALKRGDRFSMSQWDGANATYLGQHLDSINMARVVGFMP
jgi:hypothetical protein